MDSASDGVQASLRRATELYQQGRPGEAQVICREILDRQAGHAATLRLLGMICAERRDWVGAAEMLGKAILAEPHHAQTHSDQGAVLKLLNQWNAALASYDEAVRLEPGLAEAHCGRGNLLLALRRRHDAIAAYDRAIALRPEFAKAYYNRGVALTELAQWEDALASYQQATRVQPDYSLAHGNCGVLLERLGRHEAALESYDRAIEAAADNAQALSNRGNLLRQLKRLDDALASCDRAIAIKPGLAEAHYHRSVVLWDLGRFAAAMTGCDQAIALCSDYAEAYSLRGNLMRELGRWDEALANFAAALAIRPDFADAYCNRGAALSQLQRLDESLVDYDKAIALAPDHVAAHWNRAYALLLRGDYTRGWREHEWRRRHANCALHGIRHFREPLWLGEASIAGRTILLHSEQGFGDTIQFSRYATMVANLGAAVILQVQGPLVGLLSSLDGVAKVVDGSEELPAFDLHCPLMSLPLAFNTTLDSTPSQVPYLRPDANKVSYWKQMLGEKKTTRVGLVWSGGVSANQPLDRSRNGRRNIPLAKLAPLQRDNVAFYSLQKGESAVSELAALKLLGWQGPSLLDFTDLLHDFSDTAALIENLDLVISVDTSTAHLAGALGKPVWLLNRFDTCWRWLLDRADSPWYPTLTVYRQDRDGDWDGVVNQVKEDLARF